MSRESKKFLTLLLLILVILPYQNCGKLTVKQLETAQSSQQSSNYAPGPQQPQPPQQEPEDPEPPATEEPPAAPPVKPNPVPAPPPAPPPTLVDGPVTSISVDGVSMKATPLDTITTVSGKWPVFFLGNIKGGKAYLWNYESKPKWWSVCLVKYPVAGLDDVDEQFYQLKVNGYSVPVSVLQGSMKCVDHSEPVQPTIERLKSAVSSRRVVPYSLDAFKGWRENIVKMETDRYKYNKLGYNPSRIYGRSSSNNSIDYAISGQAGEYGSSRGFLSSSDALMIASALAENSPIFYESSEQNRIQTLYGLSIPRLLIWSENHHLLRDPQHPFTGDRPYVNEGALTGADDYENEGTWTPPADHPYLGPLEATAGTTYQHRRDEAHLFNHGYAYWLSTGDPRAALLQQAIAAYALASIYTGGYKDGRYKARFGYQRATMNVWNAMWKLRDVALNITTENGNLLWSKDRSLKMVDDILQDWKANLAEMDADKSSVYSISSSIFRGIDLNTDNAYSNFMIQTYGPDSAYLFAGVGFPDFLKRIGENMILRYGKIGGRRGITCNAGSGYPVLSSGTLPYSNETGYIDWINNVRCASISATDLNETGIHTALRANTCLLFARDAIQRGWLSPLPGLDAAISKAEAARKATTKFVDASVLSWKHGSVPFEK